VPAAIKANLPIFKAFSNTIKDLPGSGVVGFAYSNPEKALKIGKFALIAAGTVASVYGLYAGAVAGLGLNVLLRLPGAVMSSAALLNESVQAAGFQGVSFKGGTGFFGEAGSALSENSGNPSFTLMGRSLDVGLGLPTPVLSLQNAYKTYSSGTGAYIMISNEMQKE